MGKFAPGKPEKAAFVAAGSLNAVSPAAGGVGAWAACDGRLNLFITGAFVATCRLEASFDGGTTAVPITNIDGSVRTITMPELISLDQPENGVLLRLVCTAFTSGAVGWRFSK